MGICSSSSYRVMLQLRHVLQDNSPQPSLIAGLEGQGKAVSVVCSCTTQFPGCQPGLVMDIYSVGVSLTDPRETSWSTSSSGAAQLRIAIANPLNSSDPCLKVLTLVLFPSPSPNAPLLSLAQGTA